MLMETNPYLIFTHNFPPLMGGIEGAWKSKSYLVIEKGEEM